MGTHHVYAMHDEKWALSRVVVPLLPPRFTEHVYVYICIWDEKYTVRCTSAQQGVCHRAVTVNKCARKGTQCTNS